MLPVINIERADTAAAVTASLLDSGFAVLQGHGVTTPQLEQFYRAWDQFFLADDRFDYQVDASSYSGYFSDAQAETAKGHDQADLKEYFQYYPDCHMPARLRDMTATYFNQLLTLGQSILGWLQTHTDPYLWRALTQPLDTCLDPQTSMLRLLRYPPLSGNEPAQAIRAAAHEDINLITLLPAASTAGLEIKPKGAAWQAVDPPPGSLIINIGDMLQELTQGALPSTTHRVVNPQDADASLARLTAPLFCHPPASLRLSARYTAGEYLHERLTEISPNALKPAKQPG